MKKLSIILIVMSLLIFTSGVVSAKHNWHGNNQPYEHDRHWKHHPSGDRHYEHSMPFRWHDHRYAFHRPNYRLERIYDHRWEHRFPGLHPYRWYGHDHGFWHDGRYIQDAILFFDRDEEVVAFGYFRDGTFLMVRQDEAEYESDDAFFFSWWSRHRY